MVTRLLANIGTASCTIGVASFVPAQEIEVTPPAPVFVQTQVVSSRGYLNFLEA